MASSDISAGGWRTRYATTRAITVAPPPPKPKPDPTALPAAKHMPPPKPVPALPAVIPAHVAQTPDAKSKMAAPKFSTADILMAADMAVGLTTAFFLLVDFLIFTSFHWAAPHSSSWLMDYVVFPDQLWSTPNSPNIWEVVTFIVQWIAWLLWNTAVFLIYLTTRDFLTNVGLWGLLYFWARHWLSEHMPKRSTGNYVPRKEPVTVHNQNAFGDAGFASPSSLAKVLSGDGDASQNEFFED